MSLYSDLAMVADDLLAEFGQAVTLRHRSSGDYDPETGGASVTSVDSVAFGAVFDYGTNLINGTIILSGDKQLLISPVGISAPVPDDLAIVGTDTYTIVRVKTTAPAGVAVIHDCQVRK